jgi:hypothetical protein
MMLVAAATKVRAGATQFAPISRLLKVRIDPVGGGGVSTGSH